ncbi:TonB-dependent siderophore receptor [Altererythrobacter sp. BO-6]|uniref:TonB-dependent receptor n=1 Tax=Altererythrobacter sp. BO-6 TaxID=2604537 RepID=UPI0013E1B849|nr:TonB-dependent siderophore receptor [Altererythrobacter sp. BO-6]QIG54643.1 TonB-dependent siderophore receptor [Altererythrobacter sp. BO-6]
MKHLGKAFWLAGAALIAPATALAAESTAEQDRQYLPEGIIVTGERQGYAEDDGSTGTKTPTPVIDVPQTITFVTEDQLEDQSIRQLGEALRYVPGISIETGEGHRDEIFIRGQETTADFYLDGLRDDAQYYRSLYNIERVEVLKGANALIFGRGGGGGVINRVSKTARINGFEAEVDASVDTFGAFSLSGDVNTTLSGVAAARLNATYEEFDSNRDFYSGHFIGISPTVTVDLGEATRLTATYSYDEDQRLVDRGLPADGSGPLRGFRDTLFGDPDFNDTDSRVHIARARIDHEFSSSLTANATLQFADYDKAYQNIVPDGLRNGGADVQFSGYRDTQTRQNWIAQANLVWELDTGALQHMVLAGVEASWQDSNNGRSNSLFANGTGGTTSRFTTALTDIFAFPAISLTGPVRDRDSELEVFSAYLQDQIDIGEHLQLIAGLRWDRFDLRTIEQLNGNRGDRVDEKVSPRFGLVVKPNPQLSLYASYATSFLPQAGDQFFLLSPGDAAFAPEKFTNYELGVKWAPSEKLFVTAAVFQLDRTNTKGPDPLDPSLTALVGESRTKGLEFNLVGEITPRWQANIGYTYLDGEITSTSSFGAEGLRLQQLPEHQISAWTRYDFSDSFGLGLGVIYQDEQFASFSNAVTLPDYLRVDAAAYYTVSERLSLQLNVENLFDANYFPSAHGDNNIQPGRPLSARLGVRVKL